MTLNRCHGEFCACAVFFPRQPLPCGSAGRCAGVIDVARALCCLWSAAVTGFLFPGVTRSPLSVVLAALSAMRRAAWQAKAAADGVSPSDLLRQAMARTRTWTARAVAVERERTRQVARIGNNLNQIARWANAHAETADAVEIIAHLVAIEREIARLARFGD